MIWLRQHMGPQRCVGGVISQSSKQFMYPSGENIALGSYLPSSSRSKPYNPRGTVLRSAKTVDPLAYISISIQTLEKSPPSPNLPSQPLICSQLPATTNNQPETSEASFPIPTDLETERFPEINAENHHYHHSKRYILQNQLTSDDKIHAGVLENPTVSTEQSGPDAGNGHQIGGDFIDKDCIGNLGARISPSERLDCMPCGQPQRIMNEREDKNFWDKEKVNTDNNKSKVGNAPASEEKSAGSSASGSLPASDTSEDSHGTQGNGINKLDSNDNGVQEPCTPFLFLGPVGKKRKYCRDRQKSGDPEPESPSPASLPPPTPLEAEESDKDASSIEGAGTPELDGSPSTSSSSRSTGRVRRDDLPSPTVITSTPTPVIRSVPHARREEQPLNLSLPSPSEHSSIIRSPGRRNEGVQVSVISMAPRERDEEHTSSFPDISSPSLSFYSRSPRESSGELTPGGARLSPQPSTSRGFHSISSGGDSGLGAAPSTFQGLLVAHGIVPPANATDNAPSKKKLKCRDCGKEFSQLRNYRYHRSRHEGTQQFACTCPICGKTFNDKGYLSSHLKIHRNAKEYKCEWCEKSFNQRVAYNMHVRIHTGHKPHKCPLCVKAFSRKMLLRQHLRTHTGERPYSCEICQKAFADRSNMLLHQRLHSGQRPYKCEQCGKSFSKNHHLKTHLNHHAGIKPYQCEKCKTCFSQSSNMKTHFRKCSGIPSVTSTVTSGSAQRSRISPEHSMAHSSNIHAQMATPPGTPRYNITNQENINDQDLNHHQQLLQQVQQSHLQRVASHQQQQLLRSGHQSASAMGQAAAVQALGLNLGIMGLANAGIRSRRAGNLLPLGSPSPTSLAAGHPFIPLASLESAASSGAISPPSMPSSPMILHSPRHHSNIHDANSVGFPHSHPNSLPQSPNPYRTVTSRSRSASGQQQHQSYINHQILDAMHDNRGHQLPSSQLLLTPRQSPQRQTPTYRTHSPEQYEVVLPAIAVSRNISHGGQQFYQEQFAQQMRPHGLHPQRIYINGDINSQYGNQAMQRPLSVGQPGMLSPRDRYTGLPSPLQYSEQDLSPRPSSSSSWRNRDDDNPNSNDGQFRGTNS